MDREHYDRILRLLDVLVDARIYAGAEFEALANERNYKDAQIFETIRDELRAQIKTVTEYKEVLKGE